MKIALTLCPSWDPAYPVSSLALLSAALAARGHEPLVFDLNAAMHRLELAAGGGLGRAAPSPGDPWTDERWVRESFLASYGGWLESVVKRVAGSGCRLAGFSTYSSNAVVTLEVARLIKRLAPEIQIVLGGPSCLTFKECLAHLQHECVDAVVLGEADRSLPDLVDRFARTGKLTAAPGVLLRRERATWKDEQDRVEDMDSLPFGDFSVFEGLTQAYFGKTLHTTRGCVRKCVFCADWREMPYRHMSGERVFRELARQLERHPSMTRFMFGDSVLNGALPELEDFCERVISADVRASWSGYAIVRPDMKRPLLEKMSRAGCKALFYGIESGSQAVLRAMNKHVPPGVNAEALRETKAAGIKTFATWIVGFPSETAERFEESLAFVRANAAHIDQLTPSLFSIVELKDDAERYGLKPTDSDLFWRTDDGENDLPERLRRLRRLMETCAENGVSALYQGKIGLAELPDYERRLLALSRA